MNDPAFGMAWTGFALALAVHVADEAAHDFLAFYNPVVRAICARVPLLPIPTFTFPVWIGGLVSGVVLLLALSPLAWSGAVWLKWLAWPLAILVGIGNGLLHLIGSAALRRWLPGTFSAPLILLAGAALLATAV